MARDLDWNKERYRTRDLLLEYDAQIVPLKPHTAGLAMIYPWENLSLSVLKSQIFQIALNCGYIGEESEFWENFVSPTGGINTGTIETFPTPGRENELYLDTETEILYYFREADNNSINVEELTLAGAEIIYGENDKVYLYIPVRARPIEPLLLNCGSSTELID